MAYASVPAASRPASIRWMQLIAAWCCRGDDCDLQYGWTLFVNPIKQTHGWAVGGHPGRLQPVCRAGNLAYPRYEGWLADRLGPKLLVAVGGVLVAIGWILNSYANELWILYLGACITGTGAGAVYATCVGNAVDGFLTAAVSRLASQRPASARVPY